MCLWWLTSHTTTTHTHHNTSFTPQTLSEQTFTHFSTSMNRVISHNDSGHDDSTINIVVVITIMFTTASNISLSQLNWCSITGRGQRWGGWRVGWGWIGLQCRWEWSHELLDSWHRPTTQLPTHTHTHALQLGTHGLLMGTFSPRPLARVARRRVVSALDSGAEGPGFKLQSRRCRVTVLGKLFTPIVPLFTKQRNW